MACRILHDHTGLNLDADNDGKIGFHGATPVVRRVGSAQAAVTLTSAQNATAAASDLGTSEALANALKANYNALQADVVALNVLVTELRAMLVARGDIKGSA
jgi:hypothetical protein